MSAVLDKPPATLRWTTMGEIADVIGGGTPRTSESENFEGGDIPWITPADLSGYTRKFISGGARFITQRGLESSSARVLPAGTVLFTSRAPIGYVAIAANPIATNQGFKSFVLRTGVLPEYVYWWLRGAKRTAESLASGTTFLELSGANAKKLPIPMVDIDEQRRIVAEIEKQFSRLDEAVANLQRVKANLKRYKAGVLKTAIEGGLVPSESQLAERAGAAYEPARALLDRVLTARRKGWNGRGKWKEPRAIDTTLLPELPVGWIWSSFEAVAERVTVGHVGSMKDEYVADGIPFLRSQNIRPNRFDAEGLKYISPAFHKSLAKSLLRPGDIGVVRSGSVGISCVIPESLPEANCSDLVIIKSPTAVLPAFGAYYLNAMVESRIAAGRVGVALVHFNTQSVAELPLPVPPLAEQHRIVAEVDRRLSIAREVEAEVDANLKRARALRQAVLSKAFTSGHAL